MAHGVPSLASILRRTPTWPPNKEREKTFRVKTHRRGTRVCQNILSCTGRAESGGPISIIRSNNWYKNQEHQLGGRHRASHGIRKNRDREKVVQQHHNLLNSYQQYGLNNCHFIGSITRRLYVASQNTGVPALRHHCCGF